MIRGCTMAETNISIEIGGRRQVVSTLKGVSDRSKNMMTPLRKSADVVMSSIRKNFSTAGSLLQKPWQARRMVYSWPILNKTGAMKGGFLATVTNSAATISNRDPKFKYHQSSAPRRRLPRREMLGHTGEDIRQISLIIGQYIVRGTTNG